MYATKPSALAAIVLLAMMAPAAAAPPSGLISGAVASAFTRSTNGWCEVAQGPSTFQENSTGTLAVIALPELVYFDGGNYYNLSGQGQLTFGPSQTGGTIKFIGNGTTSHFAHFRETFNGKTYQVSFTIEFVSTCPLQVAATFQAP